MPYNLLYRPALTITPGLAGSSKIFGRALPCQHRTGARHQRDHDHCARARRSEGRRLVKIAVAAVSDVGGTPTLRAGNGELDANWIVHHGVPPVTFGAGHNEPHTTDEWISRDEYERARACARCATMG